MKGCVNMKGFSILKAGFFTTFQDEGRLGYQDIGMPIGGVMDRLNASMASELVGGQETLMEATFIGPEIIFHKGMSIGITGGLIPYLNGKQVPTYTTIKVKSGDLLDLRPGNGFRAYIGFSDQLILEEAFHSTSTYTKASLGGYKGRKLFKGDLLEVKEITFDQIYYLSPPERRYQIRVIKGLEYKRFKNHEDFFSRSYTITDEMDRMGMRLKGKAIQADSSDIISSPVIPGTIQIPASGQAIIMLRDAQTIGGYTRIGCVISPDLDALAQMKPGDQVTFKEVTLEEAIKIKADYLDQLNQIRENKLIEKRYYSIKINDKQYDVSVEAQ